MTIVNKVFKCKFVCQNLSKFCFFVFIKKVAFNQEMLDVSVSHLSNTQPPHISCVASRYVQVEETPGCAAFKRCASGRNIMLCRIENVCKCNERQHPTHPTPPHPKTNTQPPHISCVASRCVQVEETSGHQVA